MSDDLHQYLRGLQDELRLVLVKAEMDGLIGVLKDASTQPRVPAGVPEGGQFASGDGGGPSLASRVGRAAVGAAGDMGRVAVGAARGAGRAVVRTAAFARNAWFTLRLNGAMRRQGVSAPTRAAIATALLTGPEGVRRQLAQSAASAAAMTAIGSASQPSQPSVSITNTNIAQSGVRLRKAADDDDGSWFVNKYGLVFAVVDDVYYLVDGSDIPALVGLSPGEYTHAEFAATVAEAEEDDGLRVP